MGEWKEYKLGDVISLGNGKVRPKETGNIPIYGGNGILGYCNSSNYDGETVIIGRVGAYCGSVYYENRPIWISDNALAVKSKKGYSTKFIYYLLKNLKLNDYAEGSSHPLITQTLLNAIDVLFIDDIGEQKSIASILSSLDDKIELLHNETKTLEAMTETLFRKWFIEDAKEEWEEKDIYTYAEHYKVSIVPNKHPQMFFRHYSIPAFDNGKEASLEKGECIQSNKYIVPGNCILFSKLNPHKDKRVWLILDGIENNAICSTEFQIIKPKKSDYLYFLYGWLTSKENYEEISSGVGGTSGSHQRIEPKSIFTFSCPNVDIETIYSYNKMVEPLYYKQKLNENQIINLKEQRDKLLQKLMSNK